jgi:hypothetical protein
MNREKGRNGAGDHTTATSMSERRSLLTGLALGERP